MANEIRYSNAEVKAGIFLTLGLALFIALLFIFGKMSPLWRARQTIDVVFTSVTSLRPDAPVRYNGVGVGHVKDIQIIRLTEDKIQCLPHPFKPADLENLPLTEKEQKQLRNTDETPAKNFEKAVEEKLANRTMIKLLLEVVQEPDFKRYRTDDNVHISTTIMGDTTVEISSGSSTETLKPGRFVLGHSGDFFSNLAKSVEQVKELLASVSDVVGHDERESVRRALRRFDTITDHIEKIVKLADSRLPATWDRLDGLADSAKNNFNHIGDAVSTVQPQITKTLTSADDAVKDLQDRIGKLADEAKTAVLEIKGQVKPVFADLQYITSKSKEDFPVMIKNARDLAVRLQESAGKLDSVLYTGNRLLNESYPDLRRLILAFRMGAENFEEMTSLLRRKPWLIYNKGPEDTAYDKAQKTTRDLEIATKRFAELSTELQAIRRNFNPEQTSKEKLERIDFIIQELNILGDTLKFAGDVTRKEVLPPFERKKGSFTPVAEEFDPKLGRKETE